MSKYKIPDIPALVYKQKESKIKRYPCNANRASGLGYAVPELEGCLRRGVYERTHWEQKALHDGRLQMIFDEGNHQEIQIYKDLMEADVQIIEQQTSYSWPEYQITGHIDGKLVVEDAGDGATTTTIPCEIKTMAPHIFDAINKFEDFKNKPWHRSYMVQITLYMLMQGIDEAIFILKNKSTGELKQLNCELDYELGEAAIRAAETINKHLTDGTLPPQIDDADKCADCPFNLICKPDIDFGVPLQISDDPALESKIDEYLDKKGIASDIKSLYDKQIKPKLKASADEKGNLNVMLGKYHITGKTDARGTFRNKIVKIPD